MRQLAILDIDTTDENVFADALDKHGETPVKDRTASGKFHAWYRFNHERRRIRPDQGLPLDLLGYGGYSVAPLSRVSWGRYTFICTRSLSFRRRDQPPQVLDQIGQASVVGLEPSELLGICEHQPSKWRTL
jgi:hypothetical protein